MHPQLLELEKKFNPSLLTAIHSPLLEQKQIELWVKRDDLIHPVISGNKWRKLKYILDHAITINCHTILSMGGAYSNHLHALAFAGKQLGLKTIGYIRGERPENLSPTLQDIQNWGMELRFISRAEYRELRNYKKYNELPAHYLKKSQDGQYWLPEGGATELALLGVGELVSEIDRVYDVVCVPCGTGTTFAGIISSVPEHCTVQGFSALKGAGFLNKDVEKILNEFSGNKKTNWTIQLDYHFGGFAKRNNALLLFIEDFAQQHGVELEPVYTGKMFYGLFDLIQQDFFKPGQRIVAVHTGGLQGKRK
jgi:1-aminocyclopropane-1-carboxylate deaminase